jgi:hypothetical protein
VNSWTEPVVEWKTGLDSIARREALLERGELLATWPATPYEQHDTECFRLGHEFWIWQVGVGGIRFHADNPRLLAYPASEISQQAFDDLVSRSWLPAVYQVWGRQVLHASAIARRAGGRVIVFTGPSGAGKSTFAFGMSKRAGWVLVSDDTLAFSNMRETPARIALHPLRNDSRLRPATAAHYGRMATPSEPVAWPAQPLHLAAIYVLSASTDQDAPVSISRLKAPESYRLLLEQAHALTLKIPHHNQQLMCDYLDLAAAIPVFGLSYRRSFEVVDRVFDDLERHTRANGIAVDNELDHPWCETLTS